MTIDALIILWLLAFGYVGLRMGVLRQLAHWVGLLLGRSVAKPMAILATFTVARDAGMPSIGGRVAISAICFYGLYMIGTIIARFLLKRVAKDRKKGPINHYAGFTMGLGQGAIVIWVFLSAGLFFERALVANFFRAEPKMLQRSMFLGLVRQHNAFGSEPLQALAKLDDVMDAVREPGAATEDPALRELLSDPELRATLQDDKLARAIKAGKWKTLQDDPRVATLLRDPRIVGPMLDPLDYDW